MNASSRRRARFLASGLMLMAIFSSIGPSGHGAVTTNPAVQHNALTLTVNPDRSVGVSWMTASSLGSLMQNVSTFFTPGYSIHSYSNFSQQSNAEVQTSKVQHQLPPQGIKFFNSIRITPPQPHPTRQLSLPT